jgi:DNA-binding NarL/FixJ family response regulator
MPDSGALRVVVGDDSYLVREALGHLLDGDPRVDLVARCRDAAELERVVEAKLPDVVVTDIRMPPRDDAGILFANRLRTTHPQIGVVILSQHAAPRYGLALFQHGTAGRAYLLKDRFRDREHLITAIYAVAGGGSVIDPHVVAALMAVRSTGLDELTPREREILGHLAEGSSNQAIADQLLLSKKAVEKHINAIFMKLSLVDSEEVSRRVKAALIYRSAGTDDGSA